MPDAAKEAGLAAVLAGQAGALDGAAAAVELCATRKAVEQLAAAGEASGPSLEGEDATLAWLATEAGPQSSGAVGPLSARRQDDTASLPGARLGAGVWAGAGRLLRAQRQREWLLVSLRRFEQAAYQAAIEEAAAA